MGLPGAAGAWAEGACSPAPAQAGEARLRPRTPRPPPLVCPRADGTVRGAVGENTPHPDPEGRGPACDEGVLPALARSLWREHRRARTLCPTGAVGHPLKVGTCGTPPKGAERSNTAPSVADLTQLSRATAVHAWPKSTSPPTSQAGSFAPFSPTGWVLCPRPRVW